MTDSENLNESMKFPKFYLKKPHDPQKFKKQNYYGFLAEQRIGRNFMKNVGRNTTMFSQFQNTSYDVNYKQIDKHVRLVKIQNINEQNVAQSNNQQRYDFRFQPKCYFSCNNQEERQESHKIRGFEFQKQISRQSYVRKKSSLHSPKQIGDETDILAMEIKNFLIQREKNRLPDHIVFHTDDAGNDPFAKFDQMKQKMLMNNNSDVIKKPKKNHRPGTRNQQNSKSPKKN